MVFLNNWPRISMDRTIVFFLIISFFPLTPVNAQLESIRIAHFNMGQLSMGVKTYPLITKNIRNEKIEKYKDLFKQINASILCFCEYAPCFSLLPDSTIDKDDVTKNAILCNYKFFVRTKRIGMNCNSIALKEAPIITSNIVYYAYRQQKRSYIVVETQMFGRKVKIVETHLDLPRFKDYRMCQMNQLLKDFDDDKYVIICGDFNIAHTKEYDILQANGYQLANHGKFGDIVTFPWKKKGSCIDNIICKGFDIKSIQVYDTGLSDHYAITCDVMMKK